MGSTQSTWGLFDPRLSPDLHPPARDRRTSDQPYIESKPAPHMKASSAIIAALLASRVVAQASALGEGVEWFGAGQQSLGQLQALQGFWNQSPKEFGEGLWNQAVGKGVEDYGAWLHKSAGGRKLLLGENIEALGKNLEQFGQVQSGIGLSRATRSSGTRAYPTRSR